MKHVRYITHNSRLPQKADYIDSPILHFIFEAIGRMIGKDLVYGACEGPICLIL